jgi:hypothetical protein
MRKRAAVLVVASLALATAAYAATRGPNVKGTVVRTAVASGCFPGEPCDPPPNATFVVFSRNGQTTNVRIGADGAFSVRLNPGLYAVRLAPSRGSLTPATVRVPRVGVVHPRLVQKH